VRGDVRPGRNEVEPEQLEENGDVQAGGVFTGGRAPEEADDQGALKQSEA
jgi:hypothetical protein